MKRFTGSTSIAFALALAAAASAADYDPLGIAGDVNDQVNSVVIYPPGGTPIKVSRCIPFALPDTGAGLNGAVVTVAGGSVLGGVSTFGGASSPNVLLYFGCMSDPSCGFASNNVVIDEFPNNRSDTIGDILPDGTLVYRANFAGTAQNNIELVKGGVCPQLPDPPDVGTPLLSGTCTSGGTTTDCQLSMPAAIVAPADPNYIYMANTNFDPDLPVSVPTGVNIWRVNRAGPAVPIGMPDYTYLQADAGVWAGLHGAYDPGANTRQSQPMLRTVNGRNYVIFGIGDSSFPVSGTAGVSGGGSGGRRPIILCIDEFDPNNGIAGAVALLPPAGYMFVDHQATGGGTGSDVFNNRKFDMNSSGVLVAVAETTDVATASRTAAVLRYNPIFDGAGKITGFVPHPVRHRIADGGPLGDPDDVVADGLAGGLNLIPPIAGVGINDAGNLAFTANYRVDPNDPNSAIRTAVYFYRAAADALHQITRELDIVGMSPQVQVGVFATRDSDSFSAPGLADNADVIATGFRSTTDPLVGMIRGVLVMKVETSTCTGDLDGSGGVGQPDLGILLSAYGKCPGDAGYNPAAGMLAPADPCVNQPDLGVLLSVYGTVCP